MATDLERLVVQLEANVRNYERAMERAKAETDRTSRRIEREFAGMNRKLGQNFQAMSRVAVGALGAIGIGVGAAQLGRLASDSLAAAEAIQDTANRVGFATDRLQELRFAADQNGSSARTLDMALQRFSRRVAEAAQGSGELKNEIDALGIPLRDANGQMRDSYSILLDYATAIQGAESEQERLRLAFKAFDSEGAQLVTLMSQGANGIQLFGARARELGIVLREDLVRQGAEANARMREMRQAVGAEATAAVLEHAQGLERMADALADIARWGIEAAANVGDFLDGWRMQGQLADPRARREALRGAAIDLERAMGQGDHRRTAMTGPLGESLIEAFGFSRAAEIMEELKAEFGSGFNNLRIEGEALSEAADRLNRLADTLMPDRSRSDPMPVIDVTPGTGSGQSADGLTIPTERGREVARVRRNVTGIDTDEADKAKELATETALAMADEVERNRGDFSRTFGRAFADGAMGAMDGDLAEVFARQLRNALYNNLFSLFEQLGGLLFDRMQGGKGGGGLGSILMTAGSAIFGGGKAAGGPVRAGYAYRVGERGPETIIPAQPGFVLPNSATQPMRGTARPSVIAPQIHLHAENAVMTEELVASLEKRANAAAAKFSTAAYERAVKDAGPYHAQRQRLRL